MAYVNTLFNKNFLEYASYVIKDRAIPHIDDGLKPVQRRILHSLFEMDDGKFHKVANVIGHCMKYHPHGDASIGSALVVLANKELFIDKQGNFGNIHTGDEASAARYIECKITPLAKELLYNPNLTKYSDSYDGRNREPVTFPAKIPIILVQGAEGIAVGMSTRILPHNFAEVLDAMKKKLQKKSFSLYPDFLTGGLIDVSEYEDGNGRIRVRAKLDTSDPKRIVIKDIPFGSTTESLINSIEAAAKKNKIKISSIYDYTSEEVEIEIKLARGVRSDDVIDALYAFTECENSLSTNLLVIQNNTPVQTTVSKIIGFHSKRLIHILTEELKHERGVLLDRLHMRTLEQIFVEERIYKEIEEKTTQAAVHQAVKKGFEPFKSQLPRKITDDDIEKLLKIPIRRISLYDINKAKKEIQEIKKRLKEIDYNLRHITQYAIMFIDRVKKQYGSSYTRKSKIVSFGKVDVREAAQRNLKLKYDEQTGYLGHGISNGRTLFDVSPYDRILVIRKTGHYYVIDVPEKLFVDKGMLYCDIAEKENLSNIVFSVLYRDEYNNPYLKRCKIEQFILNRTYSLVPENCETVLLNTKTKGAIKVRYKKKPKTKTTEQQFTISNYRIRGLKANGVKLSDREALSAVYMPPSKTKK